jgi:hypothetical protein
VCGVWCVDGDFIFYGFFAMSHTDACCFLSVIAQIERGEAKIQRRQEIQDALQAKVQNLRARHAARGQLIFLFFFVLCMRR